MPTNNESAGGRATAARDRAAAARDRAAAARDQVQVTAIRGAGWEILELFAQYTLATLGTSSYLLVSIIGVMYSWGFYSQFESFHIFDFFDTPDFLLGAFQNLTVLFIGTIVTLVSLLALAFIYYKSNIQHAYLSGGTEQKSLTPLKVILFIIPVLVLFILPFLWGEFDSHAALKEKARSVKVTLHQDGDQSKTRLPKSDHTVLLGTTSSFHFFYECKNALKAENDQECGKGRPFIIPTANIASLEFNPESSSQNGNSGTGSLSDVAAAITELNGTISDLNLNTTISIISGEVSFDPTQVEEGIATLNKAIKNLNLKLDKMSNLGPDATSILKNLNETLSRFDEKIASLKSVENCTSSLEKVATVGPFFRGEHDQLEESTKENAKEGLDQLVPLDKLVTKMNEHFMSQQTLHHLMLLGRVDSSQFSDENSRFYGAQIELARARAEWLQEQLLKEFPTQIDPRRITLLSSNYRGENEGDKRALDRSVEVWACWAPKEAVDS